MKIQLFIVLAIFALIGCSDMPSKDIQKIKDKYSQYGPDDDGEAVADEIQTDVIVPDESVDEISEDVSPDETDSVVTEEEPEGTDQIEVEGDDASATDEDTVDEDIVDIDSVDADTVDVNTIDTDTVDLDIVDDDVVPDADLMPVLCTGQTKCYNAEVEMTCPAAGNDFYGQDAQYAALGYCTPRDYTVSGTAGADIVTDNVTGLIWQRTVNTTTYTWANAITYCEDLSYGGQTDWRLPTRKELATLPDYGRYSPAIDTTIFPGTQADDYWSSSSLASNTANAWRVDFDNGYVSSTTKADTDYARCVRGETLPDSAFAEATVAGKVVVTDTVTGLQWTKEYFSLVAWGNAFFYCWNLDYGGATDWRLPNIEELKTLVDDTIWDPASTFPGMPSGIFHSSSSLARYTGDAWQVYFSSGSMFIGNKPQTSNVRCVR